MHQSSERHLLVPSWTNNWLFSFMENFWLLSSLCCMCEEIHMAVSISFLAKSNTFALTHFDHDHSGNYQKSSFCVYFIHIHQESSVKSFGQEKYRVYLVPYHKKFWQLAKSSCTAETCSLWSLEDIFIETMNKGVRRRLKEVNKIVA